MIEPKQRRLVSPFAGLLVPWLLLVACDPAEKVVLEECEEAASPAIDVPLLDFQDPDVSRHNLRAWVDLLTSPSLRGRHAGEPGARYAAALLAAQMARVGLVPPRPGSGFCQGFRFLDAEDFNVVGHLDVAGLRPAAAADGRTAILVSAHYDGQGVHPAGMIYPGADDNASGVSALLEVARLALRRESDGGTAPAWVFAAFGAEEGGQQGAHAYLADPSVVLSRIELAVNLDMIGRRLPGEPGDAIGYLALGSSTAKTLSRLRTTAEASGLEIRSLGTFGDLMPLISDAEVLATRLPTLLLSTALHEDHHQLSDIPERIDYGQIERATRLVLELGDIIAARRAQREPSRAEGAQTGPL